MRPILSDESVADATLRVGAARRAVIARRLADTLAALPGMRRAADREPGRGRATLAFETVQEERTRLIRELHKLPSG